MKTTKPIAVAIAIWCGLWLLVALYGAQAARAGWKIDRATAIAAKVWQNPCPAGTAVQWSPLPDDIGSWSSVNASQVAAWVTTGEGCVVHMRADQPNDWPWFCTIMIHEVGHLAGQHHVDNPNSVMSPTPRIDRRCADRGRPYLENR